jgi:hypothetical protein
MRYVMFWRCFEANRTFLKILLPTKYSNVYSLHFLHTKFCLICNVWASKRVSGTQTFSAATSCAGSERGSAQFSRMLPVPIHRLSTAYTLIFANLFEEKRSRDGQMLSSSSSTAGTTHFGRPRHAAGCRMINDRWRKAVGAGCWQRWWWQCSRWQPAKEFRKSWPEILTIYWPTPGCLKHTHIRREEAGCIYNEGES